MVTVNKGWWNGLPADIRAGLEQALRDASAYNDSNAEESIQSDRAKVLASGRTTVHTLTPEQRAAWRDAMAPVWKQFEGEIGAGLIRAAQAANR